MWNNDLVTIRAKNRPSNAASMIEMAICGAANMRIALHCLLLGIGLAPSASSGAPPPPALVPPQFSQIIDGYDVSALYQIWRFWVERQKGAVTAALLDAPERIEGERSVGRLLQVTYTNDFGIFMTADVRVYCRPRGTYEVDRDSCHLRYRRAYVPLDAAPYGSENALSRWTQDNFDPDRLVSHLRSIGLLPGTNWWLADRARVFSALPAAEQVLREHATIVRTDSRDCPGLTEGMNQIEQRRLDWRLDFRRLGEDQTPVRPPSHGVSASYRLNITTPSGGIATIEGWGGDMDDMMLPLGTALELCERAQTRR